MEEAGVAVTEAPVVALKPVFGAQEYVPDPAAFNVVELPEQIIPELAVAETCGLLLTVTVEVEVLVQPLVVPVTVYVVVLVGLTVIDAVVAPVFHK